MNPFERFRSRPQGDSGSPQARAEDAAGRVQDARVEFQAASEQAAIAVRHASYEIARAAELGSLLAERALVASRKEAARAGIDRAERALDLIRQIRAKIPPLAADTAEYERQESEAAARLKERQDAQSAATAELERLEGEIGRRDTTLRERFGLPEHN